MKRKDLNIERRDFLKLVPITVLTASALVTKVEAKPETNNFTDNPERSSDLVRMTKELEQSLKKPMEERKWVMVIDLRKCVGCNACTVSCISENKTPPGITYRPVLQWETGEFPNTKLNFLPRPCLQCDDPPCVPVCPVNATWKREDGIVVIDYDKCIGCRYCVMACPYGARSTDFGYEWAPQPSEDEIPLGNKKAKENYDRVPTLEYQPTPWYTRPYERKNIIGITRKCHFCIHRIESGILPACVTTCIGGATYFGDIKNPNSLVNELLRKEGSFRLKEELGTKPSVYYISGVGGVSMIEAEKKLDEFKEKLLMSELRIPLGVALHE